MNKGQLARLIELITAKILEAGELATAFQGKVSNLGKKVETHEGDSQRIIERVQAKTEIDEKVQEMLLACLQKALGTKGIKIDAEEETPSKELFDDKNASLTAVIDPIDGTLEYLNNSDNYSINIGIIKNGEILTTLIYYPNWKKMYYLDENKNAFEANFNQQLVLKSKSALTKPLTKSSVLYVSNRVSNTIIDNLEKAGFSVVKDEGQIGWPEALLKCISGEYFASIFDTPQTRDVLLGALIENLDSGFKVDWKGNAISWPNGGRIPKVIFGTGKIPQEFFDCLV